jgi:hypothetical protein
MVKACTPGNTAGVTLATLSVGRWRDRVSVSTPPTTSMKVTG